jgi:3-oxoacyl-[acyl-carrier protein] reductase
VNGRARIAVVSGGSRGLGAAIAQRLLADDWSVGTFSRSKGDAIIQMQSDYPQNFYWESADLAEPDTMVDFTRAVDKRFGGIDLLINNAGSLAHQQLLLTTPPKEIDSIVTRNLVAPMVLTQACARVMTRRCAGQIVTVSSVNALRGFRGVAAYSAAKAGMDSFGRSLARELGPLGIRVNSVVPGFFDSDMTAEVSSENRDRIARRTPLGRLGDTGDVLSTILFLISPGASFVTGQALIVDGGITC